MIVEKILNTYEPAACAISEQFFQQLRSEKRFAIWGTGSAAKYAVEQCNLRGLQPICICDSFQHNAGEQFCGIPLISGDTFFDAYSPCLTLISCHSDYKIPDLFEKHGNPCLTWDTSMLYVFNGERPYHETLRQNAEIIESVYQSLSDTRSKKCFENILCYRITTDISFIEEIYSEPMYFGNDVIPQLNCGAFVDCGAFTGDTLIQFLDTSGCTFEKYYALEPHREKAALIQKYVEQNNLSNVIVLPVGVWNEQGILRFQQSSIGNGFISTTGAAEIAVDTIDNILSGEAPARARAHTHTQAQRGFIKMDIEGSEIPALLGARSIIQSDHPTLAISVYHRGDDLWEIPALLLEMNPGYRLYLRHHAHSICETVCYAKSE